MTNLTLYYDCTSSANQTNTVQLDCTANNTDVAKYNVSSLLGMCMYNVKVPVARSAAVGYSTEAALIAAIDGGFGLKWDAKDSLCDNCRMSGGQCGFDSSRNDFVCHCGPGTCPGLTPKGMCTMCVLLQGIIFYFKIIILK